ncbi:arginine deiminase family protein [Sporobacter termitidis]|nr:arginine deiminase family protein [Sporobacter termitidis]
MKQNHIKKYGIENFGRLKAVMLHRPDKAIGKITEDNREFFLFDHVPDVGRYLEEHRKYQALLESNGVIVYQLSDLVRKNTALVERLPNLAYLHDTAVVSSHGAIVSKMASRGRCHEEIAVGEALHALGIPTLYEPPEGDSFEGCLLIDGDTVFVADTERHNGLSIRKFIGFILEHFSQVIYAVIPKERRFMHPDMVLNRMTEQLMVWYPPAFQDTYLFTKAGVSAIELKEWMARRHVTLVPLSDKEQQRWGSSFVPLEPGLIINYDISLEPSTIKTLEHEGVRFIHFHPDALLAGGGSLRCLTMRLWRE